MKIDVIKLDGKKAGSVELVDDVFGLEPRADILHRVVRWQRKGFVPWKRWVDHVGHVEHSGC